MYYLLSIEHSYKGFIIIIALCVANCVIDVYRKHRAKHYPKQEKRGVVSFPFAGNKLRKIH